MATFNRAELDKLERHEFQLSILSAIFVLILASGTALLMYPVVFVRPDPANKWSSRVAFAGFCVLSVLFVVYVFSRQRTVRKLKQSLVSELERNIELRHKANVDLLHTIPDISYFQDRLLMECRRATSLQKPLSLIVAQIKLSGSVSGENEKAAILGEVARSLSRNLRRTDSIYVLGQSMFGMVLPESDVATAKNLAMRLEDTLKSIGAPSKFTSELVTRTFPDEVQSAHEFEEMVNSLTPSEVAWTEVPVNS